MSDTSEALMALHRIEGLLRDIKEKLDHPMNVVVNVQAPADFTAGELAEVVKRGIADGLRYATDAQRYDIAAPKPAPTAKAT